jgi:hypothetical protein
MRFPANRENTGKDVPKSPARVETVISPMTVVTAVTIVAGVAVVQAPAAIRTDKG